MTHEEEIARLNAQIADLRTKLFERTVQRDELRRIFEQPQSAIPAGMRLAEPLEWDGTRRAARLVPDAPATTTGGEPFEPGF